MFDSLGQLGSAFVGFMNPHSLFNVLWATFLGIPVPLWGVLGYGGTFALAMLALQPAFAESRRIALALLAAGTIGFGFSVYLSAVEQFLIGAWCRWCIGSAVVATLMFVATLFEIPRIRRTA